MIGILPTVLVRIYRFMVFGWYLSFLAVNNLFYIKSKIQLYSTTCIISSVFELNQYMMYIYLMYFAHYDMRHLFFFFNVLKCFNFCARWKSWHLHVLLCCKLKNIQFNYIKICIDVFLTGMCHRHRFWKFVIFKNFKRQ